MSLENVQRGNPIKSDDYNDVLAGVRKLQSVRGTGGIKNFANGVFIGNDATKKRWVGKVVCCGTCDSETNPNNAGRPSDGCDAQYKDNRYWVTKCKISNAGGDCSDATTWEPYSTDDVNYKNVTVTNLAENNCGSHNLHPGTLVEVVEEWDAGAPPTYRYWMEHTEECGTGDCKSSISSSSSSSSQSPSSRSPSSGSPTSGSGSHKSTAIVPASWSSTGFTSLFISEGPDVRFDDTMIVQIEQTNQRVEIDPKFLEVCEPGSVEVVGVTSPKPLAIGAEVIGGDVVLRFARSAKNCIRVVIRLSGIRAGFAGMRFEDRTEEQFHRNEEFINSAY